MKNVLFATSALVAFGGAAMAAGHASITPNLTLKGSAEIGVFMVDEDNVPATQPNDGDFQLHHDMDLDITLSATSGGLTFGADIDLDELNNGISNRAGPHTVFIEGNFGILTVGDTDGAFDKAMTEIAAGSTIIDDGEHNGWNGNAGYDGLYDGQIARYDYSFSSLTASLSVELDDGDNAVAGDPLFGVGASYAGTMGGVTLAVGVGYQTVSVDTVALAGDHDIIGASVKAGFGPVSAIVNYSTQDRPAGVNENDYIGVSLEYTTGMLTVGANYGENDGSVVGAVDGFALFASYDLGGGASVVAGYSSTDADAGAGVDTDTASLGLALSF